jgi:hypothetical protein
MTGQRERRYLTTMRGPPIKVLAGHGAAAAALCACAKAPESISAAAHEIAVSFMAVPFRLTMIIR